MSFAAIQQRYGVPAYHGRRISYEGRLGRITSARGHHLGLELDDDDRITGPYHPLWHIDYLDGIDHGIAYDRRVEYGVARMQGRSHKEAFDIMNERVPEPVS